MHRCTGFFFSLLGQPECLTRLIPRDSPLTGDKTSSRYTLASERGG